MASLALLVSFIFLIVILLGPVSYLISLCQDIPVWIIWFLGLSNIVVGIWWFLLPLPAIRYIGLMDVWIGVKLLLKPNKKETQG